MRFLVIFCFSISLIPSFSAVDLVIRNGLVYDGSGNLPEITDISIEGGRIISVGEARKGILTLDAKGMAVAPGFIDVHTHA